MGRLVLILVFSITLLRRNALLAKADDNTSDVSEDAFRMKNFAKIWDGSRHKSCRSLQP